MEENGRKTLYKPRKAVFKGCTVENFGRKPYRKNGNNFFLGNTKAADAPKQAISLDLQCD